MDNLIYMRGRNGTVHFGSFEVWGKELANVDFYSGRKGRMPPIKFDGDVHDLIDLFEDVVRELRELEKSNRG